MIEWFHVFWKVESPENTLTSITVGDRGDPLIENPIQKGEGRKAQPVGPWNKQDPYDKNHTTEGLMEVFGYIKLTGPAEGALLWESFYGADRLAGTAGWTESVTPESVDFARSAAGITQESDCPLHKAIPNFRT